MELFCKNLPKIELHAHLNGSLSDATLEKLQTLKNGGVPDKAGFKITKGDSKTLTECFAVFGVAHALTDTPAAVKLAVLLTLKEFSDDGVAYLELRSTPRENGNMTKTQYIEAMVEAVRESSQVLPMITCLIVSIDRRNTMEQASNTVCVAIDMYTKYPDIVLGLDLSGDPRVGKFSDFAPLLSKGREAGLKVTVHAAEIVADEETLEILKWKPDRIGHGIYIPPSILLWDTLLESKIPLELCLSSNVLSGAVTSFSDHHFQDLFKVGHPISLATDDKGVFSTTLSQEYLICAETFQLGERELKELSFKAVDQIFSGEDIKEKLRRKML